MTNQPGTNQELHVIFGTGPVGLAVMDELLSRGKQVRLVNRSGRAAVPVGVQVVAGDATDATFTRQVCTAATVVYQCSNPPYTEWAERFPPLQAGVLAGATTAGAKLVSMENVYMYGSTGGKPLVESLPYAAQTRKGKVRAAMAEALLAAHQQGSVRVAIGRAGDFFGPRVRVSAMAERVFPAALAGKTVQLIGNPDLPHTFFVLAIAMPWLFGPLADAIFYSGLPTLLAIVLALPFEILVASPLLAALIVTAITGGKAGVKSLLRKFTQWRVGWGWYAVALLLPPAIALIAAYLNVLWGAPLPTLAIFGSASSLLFTFALRLINPWDGPLMEELGWRGFALTAIKVSQSVNGRCVL